MNNRDQKLISWLFETNAVRVCPEKKPFWYTSGTIGPYYINTHFLYGSEQKANELLKIIDEEKTNVFKCPVTVLHLTWENYKKDPIYKGLIDETVGFIRENINLDEVGCISGGERRDWFFSLIIADILNKPHVTIYKDMASVISVKEQVDEINDLASQKVLHIADLITEASSYERAWIPAIKRLGGEIKWSVVVVDRMQGGGELLAKEGIQSFAMVNIDKGLFEGALNQGLIKKEQYDMVVNYLESPKESMKKFLLENPEFLENALNGDEKTKERAKLCIEKNIYGLK
ncbi:MAG: orotate phosphoribosyltransferase [Clostridia bacterium]|nr:orotate phosphoribosyltransferase [Clostridia bacterium]